MNQFDKLYRITEEVKDLIKKPFAYKKMKRTFEAKLDALESSKEDALARLDDLRIRIANGSGDSIDSIVELKNDIESYEKAIEVITAERDLMDEKVVDEADESKKK